MKPLQALTTIMLSLTAIIIAGSAVSCRPDEVDRYPKVVVLGFDGMDPKLCERMMDAGKLPNLDKLRKTGGFKPLGTTMPPQSPVAWASFITGANPGGHGIFDFIHRNPEEQCMPFYAAAETVPSDDGWEVGEHRIPLTFWPFQHNPTQTLLRRGGTPFWDYLDQAGIPVWIYDIPANYPPSKSEHGHMHCLAGMGVPDLLGGYGTYQFFSTDTPSLKREPGGVRKPLIFINDTAIATLTGPENSYLLKPASTEVRLQIHRHPTDRSARIEFQGNTVVLKEGEWSKWQKLSFELEMPSFLPNEDVSGICRLFLQQVRPELRLYVTPINIDPSDPGEQNITEPPEFITDIADELGLFYTAGFQEDHKALSNKLFTDTDYHSQADYVLKERLTLRNYALDHYDGGLLFFYFSSTDLQAHMFWWDSDEKHPTRPLEEAKKYHQTVVDLYTQMDDVVGETVDRFGDDATILVMSDHGFCNFRRQFNLNTWLRDNGYVQPSNCKSLINPRRGALVNWAETKAYGLGLNGLYLNMVGRERDGIVYPHEREALIGELTQKLLAIRDPQNNQPIIAKVYRSDEIYSGPFVATAPDLLVGYHRGYRASWSTTLGDMARNVISDNSSAWSADHCVAADQVPGVIFSNKPLLKREPALVDMAPTILDAYGVPRPDTMEGASILKSDAVTLRPD